MGLKQATSNDRLVALVLALVPFTALGLGRFAYGLLLPTMRAELSWSYLEAGVVTTANTGGYLIGAAMGAAMLRRHGEWSLIVIGSAAIACAMAGTAIAGSLVVISLFRFAVGLVSGWAFLAGSTFAARLSKAGAPAALVWYPAGAGLAVVITAAGHSAIATTFAGWRAGWLTVSALGAVAAALLAVFVPRTKHPKSSRAERAQTAKATGARVRGLEISYGLFGLGYISYVTFAGAYVKGGPSTPSTGLFWTTLGLASVVGAFTWPSLFARHSAGAMYPITLVTCSAGVIVLLIERGLVGALASAALFGFSFLAVVSGVSASARDRVPPEGWASALGWVTVIFGAGQTLGPLLGGALGDTPSGLRLGLAASAAILLIAAIAAFADNRTVAAASRTPA